MCRSFLSCKYMTVLAGFLLLTPCLVKNQARAADTMNTVESVSAKTAGDVTRIKVSGKSPLISTVYELPKPYRVIVDIADAKLAADVKKVSLDGTGITVKTSEITDAKPTIARIEFFLPEVSTYTTRADGNDLLLDLNKSGKAAAASNGTELSRLDVVRQGQQTILQLLATGTLGDFSHDYIPEQGNVPARLYLDFKGTQLSGNFPKEQRVGTSISMVRAANRADGARVIVEAPAKGQLSYKIDNVENGLKITVAENTDRDQVSKLIDQKKTIEGSLPDINPLTMSASPQAREQQVQDAFNYSGYNKERISVEFQKMDLHNVFNFLRQVSGVNIVVDESVKGSLTLVLDEVPWDFALDIILNLKDLEKEEQFNTLVIYPKGKGFRWSKESSKNLSFEADSDVLEEETLTIRQQERLSPAVQEAKELLGHGREAEKREDYETAAQIYLKAFDKWPSNAKLANRIASLYLMKLRQNAKALYFAKKSLDVDNSNASAALNAAIAAANMHDVGTAQKYFDQAVATGKPKKEALMSYAAFCESKNKLQGALALLDKYKALYGDTFDSMIATARIYDKLGDSQKAVRQYQALLLAGFQVPPDLAKYIKGRIALAQSN